ncbi:MAG: branched-chain amino acid ABC transporter permease [Egibacteraceae bacterium]
MELVAQLFVNGFVLGASLAVVALGLSLIFGVMGVVNFLHAELVTLGGYVTYFLVTGAGASPLLGFAVSVVGGIVIGLALQRTLLTRIVDRPPLDSLLLTYGLSVIGLGLITHFFTGNFRSYSAQLPGGLAFGGVSLSYRDLLLVVVCAALVAALAAFLRFTRTGAGLRATAQHREAAAACGVDLLRMDALAYALGAALGAGAGAALSMSFVVTPLLGRDWLLDGFVVVILGGLGSMPGAVIGGVIIGVAQAFFGFLLDDSWARLLVYSLLFVGLLARPRGLLGTATT